MTSIISFIIVLGVLIFVHEFGHFITAKLFKVKVLKFSLGFGNPIISRTHGETQYLLSALPLGGYVKMLGEQPDEPVPEHERRRSFSHKPTWKRFLIVLAGPVFNLVFAWAAFVFLFSVSGIPHPVPGTTIGAVTPDSPAAEAGIAPGDTIIELDGRPVDSWEEVSRLVRDSGGRAIAVTIRRQDGEVRLRATPRPTEVKNIFGEVVETRYMLGIAKKDEVEFLPASPWQAITAGTAQTAAFIDLTVTSIVKIFQRVVPASEIGGPIMIAGMAGEQMEAGWQSLLSFMAVLSINLGIINLFPIPVLDGGHLALFGLEALRGKPLTMQAQVVLQQIGIALLASLMIFVFYNDIARLLAG